MGWVRGTARLLTVPSRSASFVEVRGAQVPRPRGYVAGGEAVAALNAPATVLVLLQFWPAAHMSCVTRSADPADQTALKARLAASYAFLRRTSAIRPPGLRAEHSYGFLTRTAAVRPPGGRRPQGICRSHVNPSRKA